MGVNFPLEARFRILAIASQISVSDAAGTLLYYVRQKAFKLREAVTVFADEAQTRPLFTIEADRVLDLSARYRIQDTGGTELAVVQRHGMRSLWRTHYDIEMGGRTALTIREENPWTKVLDGIIGGIPIIGLLSGYLLHPAYLISPASGGAPLLRVVKQPALLEGRFRFERLEPADDRTIEVAVLSSLMMLLLERERG